MNPRFGENSIIENSISLKCTHLNFSLSIFFISLKDHNHIKVQRRAYGPYNGSNMYNWIKPKSVVLRYLLVFGRSVEFDPLC